MVCVADACALGEVALGWHDDTALALNGFDQEGRRVGCDGCLQGPGVGKGDDLEPLGERTEATEYHREPTPGEHPLPPPRKAPEQRGELAGLGLRRTACGRGEHGIPGDGGGPAPLWSAAQSLAFQPEGSLSTARVAGTKARGQADESNGSCPPWL